MIKTPLSTVIGGAFWTPSATILGGTSNTFDQLIKSLLSNGEQGFFYDPNDLSTMFQDAAGTIPVTGVGQPVGLVLDKSKGLVLGAEKVLGNFTDTSNWTPTNANISAVNNELTVTASSTTPANATQTITGLTVGKSYVITGSFYKKSGSNSIGVQIYNIGGVYTKNASSTQFRYQFTATATSHFLQLVINTSTPTVGDSAGFKNISVKDLAGNHAYQTTSASRPILRQNAVTGANYLEFDGSNDFLQTNNIDFTSTDKVSLFAGVRKLSDAAEGAIAELSTAYSANNGTFALGASYQNNPRYVLGVRGSSVSAYGLDGFSAPNSAVISGKLDLKGSSLATAIKPRVNGKIPTVTALVANPQGTGNYGNYPLYIGRRGGTSLPFNGHIYSLIGIGRLTTDAEIAALEKLIAKNTGVTLSV